MNDESLLSRRRRRLVSFSLLLAAVVVAWRLFGLQVTHHEALALRAQAQTESVITIPGPRGDIVDRSGERFLAYSVPVWVLATEPSRLSRTALAALEKRAGAAPNRLTARASHAWLEVRRDCDDRCRAEVESLARSGLVPADALHWSRGFKRVYPHPGRASQVLGFVNLDGTVREGLERVYDDGLRSRSNRLLRLNDAKQRALDHLAGEATPPAVATLELALDLRLQIVLEDELQVAVARTGARGGRGIVLDPKTGDVLAMAGWPSYDSNRFGKATGEQRRNPTISLAAEPGSVMKPFTAAALVETGLYRAGAVVDCERGAWVRPKRTIHDTHPHGVLSLPEVIEVSSNIGIVKFSQRLDAEPFHRVLSALGFGRKSGIDLPAEAAGDMKGASEWSTFDRDSIAFGHAITATTLQIALATATLANGGLRVTPRVARAWIHPDGRREEIEHPAPTRAVSPSTSWLLRQFMRRVVEEQHGTGKSAAVEGFFVAGKTGTAELVVDGRYSKHENLSSFVGFAPVDDPAAVVVISLEAPRIGSRTGGATAGPSFATVMAEVLRLRRIAPDNLPEPAPDEDGSAALAADRSRPGTRG